MTTIVGYRVIFDFKDQHGEYIGRASIDFKADVSQEQVDEWYNRLQESTLAQLIIIDIQPIRAGDNLLIDPD